MNTIQVFHLIFLIGITIHFSYAAYEINITSPPSVSARISSNGRSFVTTSPDFAHGVSIENQMASQESYPPASTTPRVVSLGFAIREIGLMECTGFGYMRGRRFFQSIMGPGAEASGNYLCKPTCGGDCVPNQGVGVAPTSLYPFGCRCNTSRCNADGPIITNFGSGRFKIICVQDQRCTCEGMGLGEKYKGYLCNWMNINTNRVVTFFVNGNSPHLHPAYSPVRWCSCCPDS